MLEKRMLRQILGPLKKKEQKNEEIVQTVNGQRYAEHQLAKQYIYIYRERERGGREERGRVGGRESRSREISYMK